MKHAPRARWIRVDPAVAQFRSALAAAEQHSDQHEVAVFLEHAEYGGIMVWTSRAPDVANVFTGMWLIPPWVPVEPSSTLHEELAREVCPGHPLFGVAAEALARGRQPDEVLFAVTGAPFELAVVHLTWHRETDPRWPFTRAYRDWNDLVRRQLERDSGEDAAHSDDDTDGTRNQ